MDNIIDVITRKYDLLTDTHRASHRFDQTRELLKLHTYEFRTKSQAERKYEGSLRQRLDKFTGKGDKLEQLRKEAQDARVQFEKTTWDWKLQARIGVELEKQCAELPSPEELKEAAKGNPEAEALIARREVLLCTEMLRPLLEENLKALEEYRQLLRGNRMDKASSAKDHYETTSAHIPCANQCAALLQRMEPSLAHLGEPLKISAYFLSPAGFIEGAAAKHNRLDKVNAALTQVEQLQKQAAHWAAL